MSELEAKILMKPKIEKRYVTSDGQDVKTLEEWKLANLAALLRIWKDEQAPELASDKFNLLVTDIVNSAVEIIEILSVKDRGRPLNKKDTKPRVRKAKDNSATQIAAANRVADAEETARIESAYQKSISRLNKPLETTNRKVSNECITTQTIEVSDPPRCR